MYTPSDFSTDTEIEVVDAEIVEIVEYDPDPDPESEDETFEALVSGITGENSFDQTLRSFYDDFGDWE